jgi:hypothetical protein
MNVWLLVLGGLTAFFMLGSGLAKVTGQPAMRAAAAHFDIPWSQYVLIGVAELAAVGGLLLGIWAAGLGLAAGVGVVLVMAGAVAFHARFGDSVKHWVPSLVALGASVGYVIAQAIAIWG